MFPDKEKNVKSFFVASYLSFAAGVKLLYFKTMSGVMRMPVSTQIGIFLIAIMGTISFTIYEKELPTPVVDEFLVKTDTSYQVEIEELTATEEVVNTEPKRTKKTSKFVPGNKAVPVWELKEGYLSKWDRYRLDAWNICKELKAEGNFKQSAEQIYGWTMMLFAHESRHDPKVVNSIGAAGLFQALRSTQRDLGVKNVNIHRLPIKEQLKLYKKYIQIHTKGKEHKIRDFTDWYFIGLYPEYIGSDYNRVWAKKGIRGASAARYRCNKGLDANKDGYITYGEVGAIVKKRILKN